VVSCRKFHISNKELQVRKHKEVFERSVENHIEYYRHRTPEEKLAETIEISNFYIQLSLVGKNVLFSGKKR